MPKLDTLLRQAANTFRITVAEAMGPRLRGDDSGVLLLECAVNQVLQRGADAGALRDGLRHEDDEHVFLRIDPEGGAGRAGPAHLADRTFDRADAGFGAHRKAEAETEAWTRQIIRAGHHARGRSDMVGSHIGNRFRAEVAVAVER